MDHIIFVGDKAMMSGENVADVITHHNGYVFGKSVRAATQKLKDETRDPNGYQKFTAGGLPIASHDTTTPAAYMYKVLDEVKDTYVTDREGNKKSVKGVGHYQIIYWSAKYAARAKVDRQSAVEKAFVASHSKSKDVIDNNYGKNKYLKTQIYDKQTKEQLEEYGAKVVFDFAKLEEDESLDGTILLKRTLQGCGPNWMLKGERRERQKGLLANRVVGLRKRGCFS